MSASASLLHLGSHVLAWKLDPGAILELHAPTAHQSLKPLPLEKTMMPECEVRILK